VFQAQTDDQPRSSSRVCSLPLADDALTQTEALIVCFIIKAGLPHAQANLLLQTVGHADFLPADVCFRSWASWTEHMRRISLHGINVIDLDTPAMDGTLDTLSFVYRSAWEIVCEMMQDPLFLQKWTWEYKPQHNSRGERVYGNFMSGRWVESVYSQIQDPAVTVVFVVLGSDATQIKKRLSAHPLYVSVGNLSTRMRMTRKAWRLAGFVPKLSAEGKPVELKRRRMLLFNVCAYHLLKDFRQIHEEGGRLVQVADGTTRKIQLALGMWAAGRQEHEEINMAKMHSCFHCDTLRHRRDNVHAAQHRQLKTQSSVREQVLQAMVTGSYGPEEEWREKSTAPRPKPFMKVDAHGETVVTSWTRYQHCASVLATYPDVNLLWDLPFTDLLQQCHDDPLHMIALGLMPHIMAGILTKYIPCLHPPWAVQCKQAPGFSGMLTVCSRIAHRLRATGVPLSDFVRTG
jgi:hypothetical protein